MWDGEAWTEVLWLRIGTGGGRLWMLQWTFGYHKIRRIAWLADDILASHEGLYSVELAGLSVSHFVSPPLKSPSRSRVKYTYEYDAWRSLHSCRENIRDESILPSKPKTTNTLYVNCNSIHSFTHSCVSSIPALTAPLSCCNDRAWQHIVAASGHLHVLHVIWAVAHGSINCTCPYWSSTSVYLWTCLT
jgi:hypothetical protein